MPGPFSAVAAVIASLALLMQAFLLRNRASNAPSAEAAAPFQVGAKLFAAAGILLYVFLVLPEWF